MCLANLVSQMVPPSFEDAQRWYSTIEPVAVVLEIANATFPQRQSKTVKERYWRNASKVTLCL